MRIRNSILGTYVAARTRLLTAGCTLAVLATTGACASHASPRENTETTDTAILSGSTFEGSDGNLVVDTAGDTDWANAPNRVVGIDLPSGKNDNSFGQGTKEDATSVTVVTGSIPPNKNDLARFYVASEFTGGNNFLYLAWERLVNIGSADMDFEINQANQGAPPASFTGASVGPVTLNRTAGDILITYDFSGSGNPTLGLLKWVTSGSTSQCQASNTLPCWGNRVDLSGLGFAEGAVNTGVVSEPIIGNGATLGIGLFGEAAINLTAAGVFPAGTCEAFGSAYVKSRSSNSFNAELKDFIAPVPVHISNCGTLNIHKVTQNGNATFGYTTTGGLAPSTFNLQGGGTESFNNLPPGSYSVTESTPPTGWTLVSLSCTASGAGTSASTNGATASVTMAGGGAVDCTYTNHFTNSPTITTTLSATSVTVGASVHDSATLSGASANAGGTVTYTVYSDNACSQNAQAAGTVTVTNGVVPDSNSITFGSAGTFHWQAVYSGDTNNKSATSACTSETLVVAKASPSIATTLSATNTSIGTSVHDSSTLSGATANASGTVTYTYFTDNGCTQNPVSAGTVTVTNGTVPNSNSVTFTSSGTFFWQAVYSGDANNSSATSVCTSEVLVVNPNTTSLGTGQTLLPNDSATLMGATSNAGGTITFHLFAPNLANDCSAAPAYTQVVNVNGPGTYNTTNTAFFVSAVGTWKWQVSYSGDANNLPSSSACGVETFTIAQ